MVKHRSKSFGETLREKRIEKGFSLRNLPASCRRQPNVLITSRTGQRGSANRPIESSAWPSCWEENPDEWIALAGRVADDLPAIIQEKTEVPDLLRAVQGMTAEQLRKLRKAAERMKEQGG